MGELRNRMVRVTRLGGPEGLEVVDGPLPAARRGEVRVRVLASSVEYTDVVIRRHLYPWVWRRPPFVMGYDVTRVTWSARSVRSSALPPITVMSATRSPTWRPLTPSPS